MREERLEHRLDTLTELLSMQVTALGQNVVNVALAIPLGIPSAKVKGREAQPLQKGRNAMASEPQT